MALGAVLLFAGPLSTTSGAAAAAPLSATATQKSVACRTVQVPVAMTSTGQKSENIFGKLCWPRGKAPKTVQLLVHGITYDGGYWSFPDPTDGTNRYDYVDAAVKAGFATLAIDRIGSGRSSHPHSNEITIGSNAYTVHMVVQALRKGSVRITGQHPFSNVVYVGHSYGTWVGWAEVSKYNDVDGAVFTAGFEEMSVTAPLLVLPSTYPAILDPNFSGKQLDPGYLTTLPGTRDDLFYKPGKFDPNVVKYDEKTKQTLTISEILNWPTILNGQYRVRRPTLLVAGTQDALFCRENLAAVPAAVNGAVVGSLLDTLAAPLGLLVPPQTQNLTGNRWGAANCDTKHALINDERAHLGNPPKLDAYILHGAGHDLNQALNAPSYFKAVNSWVAQNIGR